MLVRTGLLTGSSKKNTRSPYKYSQALHMTIILNKHGKSKNQLSSRAQLPYTIKGTMRTTVKEIFKI